MPSPASPHHAFSHVLNSVGRLSLCCLVAVMQFAMRPTTQAEEAPSIAAKSDSGLTAEGVARLAAHQFLFHEFTKDREVIFKGEGVSRVLDEVVVSSASTQITDGQTLTLPPGTSRVASMFRYIGFRGKGLDRIKGIQILPFAPDSHPHSSKQEPEYYRVQMVAIPVPSESMPRMSILFEIDGDGSVTVDEVFLNSQGKLKAKFNSIPFRNLGSEHPRIDVDIDVDIARERSIAGHATLDRSKWFRYYALPGGVHPSFERWAHERNFLPGRQILKMEPAFVEGYSPQQPRLKELPNQPGKPDFSFFDAYDASPPTNRAIEPFKEIDYALCFDEWPKFMSIQPNGRGTPLQEHFQDAADLVGEYVRAQMKQGRTATWLEVKNESSIKSEWDYHYRSDVDPWGLLAEFHNLVADRVHDVSADTKVGGPTSAWMQVQAGNFGLFRNQAKFIDLTKGHLDFFSHHFYEDRDSLGAFERRTDDYQNYLLGRLETILDMFRAHMHRADNVLPIIITECGALQKGSSASDNWLRLRSYSAFLTKFMQRPDQVDLVVPFIFLQKHWAPTDGDVAFHPLDGKKPNGPFDDFRSTDTHLFFELWRDFDGRRLGVQFDQPWLDVVAVHRDRRIQLACTNMGGRRLSLQFGRFIKRLSDAGIACESVEQKRLYYRDGSIQFSSKTHKIDAGGLPIDVGETCVVTIKLDKPLSPDGTLDQRRWYAHETVVDATSSPSSFEIAVDHSTNLAKAWLVVGLQGSGGVGETLSVKFNGNNLSADTGWTNEFHHLFNSIRFEVPVDLIRESNEVQLPVIAGKTITSVHVETLAGE